MRLREFREMQSEADIQTGFPLMQQLRPHLNATVAFAPQLTRQSQQGYRLSGLWQDGQLVGLIGFCEVENMLYGRYIYVDDLVVDSAMRHCGFGAFMLNEVREAARKLGIKSLVLDTGLNRPLAQRFYFREGLLVKGMHFVQEL